MVFALFAEWDWTAPELPVDSWWFFAVVLVLLIFVIWGVARLTTSVTGDIDPAEIDRQMLTAVSELRSQGELTSEEYRSIKSRLVDRLSDQTSSADSEDSSHNDQQPQQNEGEQHQATDTSGGPIHNKSNEVGDSTPFVDSTSSNEEDQND